MHERLLLPLTALATVLTAMALGGCTHSAPTACEGDVAYTFSSKGRANYVFAHDVVPYEGLTDLPPFVPTRFFGLGPYFEQNTWEGYVNLARRVPYVIGGPQ